MPSGGQIYSIAIAAATLHRRASRFSPQDTQLILGTEFEVFEVNDTWAKGREVSPIRDSPYSGYEGHVQLRFLRESSDEPTYIVTGMAAPVFVRNDIKSGIVGMWPLNSRIIGDKKGNFVETDLGFVHVRHVRRIGDPVSETDFVTVAERHLGRPYIWAGVSSDGLDCSGLVQSSLRATGQDAPRDSCDQINIGTEIAEGESLQRGDLIFWKGHVGIMQDAEQLLHANAYHMMVASEPLSAAIVRIENNEGQITAKRRL